MSLASAVSITLQSQKTFFRIKLGQTARRSKQSAKRPKQAVAVVDKKVSRKIDFPFPLQSEKWCQGDHTCIDLSRGLPGWAIQWFGTWTADLALPLAWDVVWCRFEGDTILCTAVEGGEGPWAFPPTPSGETRLVPRIASCKTPTKPRTHHH